MSDKRQKIQLDLALFAGQRSEAPKTAGQGTESLMTEHKTESPASPEQLMEEVCQPENLRQAHRQVRRNRGSPGIDGMTVDKMPDYLRIHLAGHSEPVVTGHLPTSAGKEGGNTQAGRRDKELRRPHRA